MIFDRRILVSLAILALLLPAYTAQGEDDPPAEKPGLNCMFSLPGKIIGYVKKLFNRGGEESRDETASVESVTVDETKELCPSPYIQVGSECCLDRDGNGICDKDETTATMAAETTSTAVVETTTREAVTTTVAASTTTTGKQALCGKNSDCGIPREENVCVNGDVYVQQTTPQCQNAGSPAARCIMKTNLKGQTMTSSAVPSERCSEGCKDGKCI